VQADAEHQEDDAQLGQLPDGVDVAHEAGGKGADGDACEKIADDGGQPYAPRKHPAQEGQGQCHGDVDQQW